jgi:hypothetical protein
VVMTRRVDPRLRFAGSVFAGGARSQGGRGGPGRRRPWSSRAGGTARRFHCHDDAVGGRLLSLKVVTSSEKPPASLGQGMKELMKFTSVAATVQKPQAVPQRAAGAPFGRHATWTTKAPPCRRPARTRGGDGMVKSCRAAVGHAWTTMLLRFLKVAQKIKKYTVVPSCPPRTGYQPSPLPTPPLCSLTPRVREGDFRASEIAGDLRTISVDINPWESTGNRCTRRSGDVCPFFSPSPLL